MGISDLSPADESRVLTVPNVISLVRLLCIPVFLWLLFSRDNRAAAAWLLGVLGMTDWIDGYIARRFNQVSEVGKMLDPVADRSLLLVGVLAILIDGSAPLWFGALTLAREALVSIGTLVLAAAGASRIDVTRWGKAGTFCMMFAYPCWLGGASTLSYARFVDAVAWGFAIPGLVLSWYALAQYVPLARTALRTGREAAR